MGWSKAPSPLPLWGSAWGKLETFTEKTSVLADLQSASIEYEHLQCAKTGIAGLLSLRRRRRYGSPHQAATTFSVLADLQSDSIEYKHL